MTNVPFKMEKKNPIIFTRSTKVTAISDHYFHAGCQPVRPYQLFKIK